MCESVEIIKILAGKVKTYSRMVRKNWSPFEENDLLVYLVTSFVWFLENLMLCVTMHHKVPYCAIMVWETCGNV